MDNQLKYRLFVFHRYTYGEDVIGDLSVVVTTTTGSITKDELKVWPAKVKNREAHIFWVFGDYGKSIGINIIWKKSHGANHIFVMIMYREQMNLVTFLFDRI